VDEEKFGHMATDEQRSFRGKRSDFDSHVLGGCMVFSSASVLQLAAIAVPLLVFRNIQTTSELSSALGIASTAGIVLGVIFSLANLAGLCGSLAGLVPACTFMWLRLRDAVTGLPGIEGMEPAEYSASLAWIIPFLYFIIPAIIFIGAFYFRAKTKRSMP
jgi:hypothetical protein